MEKCWSREKQGPEDTSLAPVPPFSPRSLQEQHEQAAQSHHTISEIINTSDNSLSSAKSNCRNEPFPTHCNALCIVASKENSQICTGTSKGAW